MTQEDSIPVSTIPQEDVHPQADKVPRAPRLTTRGKNPKRLVASAAGDVPAENMDLSSLMERVNTSKDSTNELETPAAEETGSQTVMDQFAQNNTADSSDNQQDQQAASEITTPVNSDNQQDQQAASEITTPVIDSPSPTKDAPKRTAKKSKKPKVNEKDSCDSTTNIPTGELTLDFSKDIARPSNQFGFAKSIDLTQNELKISMARKYVPCNKMLSEMIRNSGEIIQCIEGVPPNIEGAGKHDIVDEALHIRSPLFNTILLWINSDCYESIDEADLCRLMDEK